jgi:hypothetical protein
LRKGGPALQATTDPVDRAAPAQQFPALLKFPVSTVNPDFTAPPWQSARLYQDVVPPKAEENEENEDDDDDDVLTETKKRNTPTPRQYILQEEVEFLETMLDRREQRHQKPAADQDGSTNHHHHNAKNKAFSSRYEGTPEHNTSHFLLLRLHPDTNEIIVTHTPVSEATISFRQPAVRKTMTLSEAEQVILDQRNGIVRPAAPAASAAVGGLTQILPSLLRRRAPQANNKAKSRLLKKLKRDNQTDDVEEGDDVMADVNFEYADRQRFQTWQTLFETSATITRLTDGAAATTNPRGVDGSVMED